MTMDGDINFKLLLHSFLLLLVNGTKEFVEGKAETHQLILHGEIRVVFPFYLYFFLTYFYITYKITDTFQEQKK